MIKKDDNTFEFRKLIELVNKREITIGVNINHANNFWYRTTILGKILNLLTPLFIVLILVVFIKFGIWYEILASVFLVIYVKALQKIAGLYVRLRLFHEEELFNAAYEDRSVTIRNNKNGTIICFPDLWNRLNDE